MIVVFMPDAGKEVARTNKPPLSKLFSSYFLLMYKHHMLGYTGFGSRFALEIRLEHSLKKSPGFEIGNKYFTSIAPNTLEYVIKSIYAYDRFEFILKVPRISSGGEFDGYHEYQLRALNQYGYENLYVVSDANVFYAIQYLNGDGPEENISSTEFRNLLTKDGVSIHIKDVYRLRALPSYRDGAIEEIIQTVTNDHKIGEMGSEELQKMIKGVENACDRIALHCLAIENLGIQLISRTRELKKLAKEASSICSTIGEYATQSCSNNKPFEARCILGLDKDSSKNLILKNKEMRDDYIRVQLISITARLAEFHTQSLDASYQFFSKEEVFDWMYKTQPHFFENNNTLDLFEEKYHDRYINNPEYLEMITLLQRVNLMQKYILLWLHNYKHLSVPDRNRLKIGQVKFSKDDYEVLQILSSYVEDWLTKDKVSVGEKVILTVYLSDHPFVLSILDTLGHVGYREDQIRKISSPIIMINKSTIYGATFGGTGTLEVSDKKTSVDSLALDFDPVFAADPRDSVQQRMSLVERQRTLKFKRILNIIYTAYFQIYTHRKSSQT